MVQYRFGPFILDVAARQLTKDDRVCRLSREGIALLALLLAERPRIVRRDVLFKRVWPDGSPDESQLAQVAAEVRRALGDGDSTPGRIRTEPGQGYAFAGAAVTVSIRRRCWPRRACAGSNGGGSGSPSHRGCTSSAATRTPRSGSTSPPCRAITRGWW